MPKIGEGSGQEKHCKTKEKKGLKSTWENLDDTSFDKGDEEANICPMADTGSEESESDQEDKVNFDDMNLLGRIIMSFCLVHLFFQKPTKNCEKDFKKLSKVHLKLKKILRDQVDISHDKT